MAIETAAAAAVEAAVTGQVPGAVGWLGAVVVGLLAVAKPLMHYVRAYNQDKAANAQSGADAALSGAASAMYTQLQQQIAQNAEDIRALVREKNEWFQKAMELTARVAKVEEYERTIQSMKARLEEKDLLLAERDAERVALMREIIALKDRLHELELRVVRDEERLPPLM